MGLVYRIIFFTPINLLAFVFGGTFISKGLLILINTFRNYKLTFNFSSPSKNYFDYLFILFCLIIYPLMSYFIQGSFARKIALGLPCLSTFFTFGFFMIASNLFPKYLLITPFV